jgi:Protein kinase domain/Phage integrase family
MELLDGPTLAQRLKDGPFDWRTAAGICVQAAAGPCAAHAAGILHRDVKPANIMLTSSGVKLVDFGIAVRPGDESADPSGGILGTPAYLAPERLRGQRASAASDVYRLGLTLYRCIAGALPWPDWMGPERLESRVLTREDLPTLDDLPTELAILILACVAVDPADRPSCGQVEEILQRLAAARDPIDTAGPATVLRGLVPRELVPQRHTGRAGRRPGRVLVAATAVSGLIEEIRPMVGARLLAAPKPESRLFTGPKGGRISTAVLRDATSWDDVVAELGHVHLVRHDLRHTGLTWMADAGVPVHVLRKIAGYGSLSTTQRYLHPDRRSIEDAGEALSAHLRAPRSPGGPRLRAV